MNDNSKIITYKLEGIAFDNGVSIYELNIALNEFQKIIEKSYLTITDQQRMTKEEREKIKLVSRKFKEGSFISELEIILENVQMTLPFLTVISPNQLWSLTTETYRFLKLIYKAKTKNKGININIGDNNDILKVNIGTKNYTFNNYVLPNAKKSLIHYDKLVSLIDDNVLDKLEAIDHDKQNSIKFDKNDKNLFDVPKQKEEKPISIKGEIYKFDKYKNAGKIKVKENHIIPEGNYSFSLDEKVKMSNIINSMSKEQIVMKVIAEYIEDPLEGKKISHFKLLKIA